MGCADSQMDSTEMQLPVELQLHYSSIRLVHGRTDGDTKRYLDNPVQYPTASEFPQADE